MRTPGYHRAVLGSGNTVKAVTRTRRAAASHVLGRAPGRAVGPADWRIYRRRASEKLLALMEKADD